MGQFTSCYWHGPIHHVQVKNTLNRERTQTYDLVVKVHDNGNTKLTATTTVSITVTDVNDNSPVWGSNTYSFTVTENVAAPEVVGQVVDAVSYTHLTLPTKLSV